MLNSNPETLFVGQTLFFLDEVDSTNNYIKELSQKKDLLEGTVVIAEFQSAGRGQHQNIWESEKGLNSLFSLYLKPCFATQDTQVISFIIGLAVRATVQQLLPNKEVKVKWPNDVMVGHKKIAGILVENRFSKHVESIVGIGLNVNQMVFNQTTNATSLRSEDDQKRSVLSVIKDCLTFVEKYYLLAKREGGVKQIWSLYVSQLYQLDEYLEIEGNPYKLLSVTPSGLLKVQRNEETRLLAHNEVKIKWN